MNRTCGLLLFWANPCGATENNLCSGECVPSQKQLKWSQLKVGLTVLAASVTLGS